MVKSQLQASKCWLITSPHRALTPMEWARVNDLKERVYDYCLAEEGEHEDYHVHMAVRYETEVLNGFHMMFPGWHVDLVMEGQWDKVIDYCKKEGNYTHKQEKIPEVYANEHPVWRSWQKKVLDYPNDDRKVICVVDERGNVGKTFLAMWHCVRHKAVYIPVMRGYQDIIRMVYASPAKMYFVDLPRALTRKQQKDIYAAAETIKNGYAYDDRYEWKFRYFNAPKIVIFTNVMPDSELLSPDRWVYIYPQTYNKAYGS